MNTRGMMYHAYTRCHHHTRRWSLVVQIVILIVIFIWWQHRDYINNYNLDNVVRDDVIHTELPRLNVSNKEWISADLMPRLMTQQQYNSLIDLTKVVTSLLAGNDVIYFMTDGTLLGSYFTHDVLPWDDDVDLLIHASNFSKVEEILKHPCVRGTYTYMPLNDERHNVLRVFRRHDAASGTSPFNWPFIDLIFYSENSSHLWSLGISERRKVYPRKVIYPLYYRPLGCLWLPAPSQSRQFLKLAYGEFRCQQGNWSHIHSRVQPAVETHCQHLLHSYPFVVRKPHTSGTYELLALRDKIYQKLLIPEEYKHSNSQFYLG